MRKFIIFFICFLMIPIMAKAQDWKEENIILTKITDGDTIKALVNGEEESIRFLDIDCYEKEKNPRCIKQSEYYHLSIGAVIQKGINAKRILEDKLKGKKELTLKWQKRDKYNRILGLIYLDNENINEYMLKFGGCEKYIELKRNK